MHFAPAAAAPGDHVRAGDLTATPEVDLGMEYRTNTYRAPTDPTPGANLRVAPRLDLDVDTTDNAFRLAGQWEVRKFLFVAADDPDLRAEQIQALDRFNDFNVRGELDLLSSRPVGLVLNESAALRNNQTDRGVLGKPFVTQVRNVLGGGVRVSPGDALHIVPGGQWSYDDYRIPDVDATRTRFNSRNAYGPTLNVKWDFFPRTSLVLDGSTTFNRWVDNEVPVVDLTSGETTSLDLPDSTFVKVRTGIRGRLTERVLLDLYAGYGQALYQASLTGAVSEAAASLRGLEGLLAAVQARYKLIRESDQSAEVGVGYKRDFEDSFFTNYVSYDYAFANAAFDVAGFRPRMQYGMRFERYSGAVVRNDVLSRLDAELGYQFRDWGRVSGGMFWQQRAVAQAAYQSAEYDDFTFRVATTWSY